MNEILYFEIQNMSPTLQQKDQNFKQNVGFSPTNILSVTEPLTKFHITEIHQSTYTGYPSVPLKKSYFTQNKTKV